MLVVCGMGGIPGVNVGISVPMEPRVSGGLANTLREVVEMSGYEDEVNSGGPGGTFRAVETISGCEVTVTTGGLRVTITVEVIPGGDAVTGGGLVFTLGEPGEEEATAGGLGSVGSYH